MAKKTQLKAPINSEREITLMSGIGLGIAMHSGPEEAISVMEKMGKASFDDSDTLPQKYNSGKKEMLEKAGVKFGENVKGDKLFQYAKLPEGWTRKSEGEYWTYLMDEKGRTRASIFYKSAFWDREAFTNVHARYSMQRMYGDAVDGIACTRVYDGKEVIFVTDRFPETKPERWLAGEAADAQAKAWLDKHFPDWKDPAAYWD